MSENLSIDEIIKKAEEIKREAEKQLQAAEKSLDEKAKTAMDEVVVDEKQVVDRIARVYEKIEEEDEDIKEYVPPTKREKRSLAKGIKVDVMSPEYAKVHIMGDYRLKFFEMVPDQPRTTKGRRGYGKKIPLRRASNRGPRFKDQSKHKWFAKAKAAKEHEAAQDIEKELIKHIQKQARREGLTSN